MIKCIYPNMVALMVERQIGIGDIASVLGRKRDTINKKLSGKNPLSLPEALELQENLFPDIPFKILFSATANIDTRAS